jgi:GWxTD domain-containing protein
MGGMSGAGETPVPGISALRPRFSVDAAIQPGEGGAPEVRLDYRLARTELLFERGPSGYRAAYEVRVIFSKSKRGRQEVGDLFQRELKVATYGDTRIMGQDVVDHVAFAVAPGKYFVEVAITDLVAERISGTSFEFTVPAQPAGQLWFTDLSLGTSSWPTSAGADLRSRLDPNPSRRYGDDVSELAVYGELVDARPSAAPAERYKIEYRVENGFAEVLFRADTTIVRAGTRTPFLLEPRLPRLVPGAYRFVVDLKSPLQGASDNKKKAVPVRREKPFDVETTLATLTADPRTSIEVLDCIATSDELKKIGNLKTEEEKRRFLEMFWKGRDPTPGTPRNEVLDEFSQRVRYANQQFGAGIPGWKTDRGCIYIRYGKPDEVVRNPFNFDRPPEEIWYYYQKAKTYFFIDKDGFGLFELDPRRSSS